MQFEVRINEVWSKVLLIYDEIAPYFLGDVPNFPKKISKALAKEIFDIINSNEDILFEFISESGKLSKKASKLIKLINEINYEEDNFGNDLNLLSKKGKEFEGKLNELSLNISKLVNKNFGVNTPKKVIVIISRSHENDYIKGSQVTSYPIINLQVAEDRSDNAHIRVIIHELLHYIMKSSGLRAKIKKFKKPRMAEEALLLFFAPYGVLSKELSIGGFNDAKKIFNKYKNNERCKTEMNFLLPYMQEFFLKKERRDVFNFLSDKKVL